MKYEDFYRLSQKHQQLIDAEITKLAEVTAEVASAMSARYRATLKFKEANRRYVKASRLATIYERRAKTEALTRIPPQMLGAVIIALRNEGMSFKEIGEIFKVSHTKARHIYKDSLTARTRKKLGDPLDITAWEFAPGELDA
jgi:hypothetical protein